MVRARENCHDGSGSIAELAAGEAPGGEDGLAVFGEQLAHARPVGGVGATCVLDEQVADLGAVDEPAKLLLRFVRRCLHWCLTSSVGWCRCRCQWSVAMVAQSSGGR